MGYHTDLKLHWITHLHFLIFFLLCLTRTASANTETFQFYIPSKEENLSPLTNNLHALPNSYQLIDLTGKTPDFDHIFKINVTNEIVSGDPIVLKLKHNPTLVSESDLYTLKVCWSAISPISYKSESFTSLTVDERTTYIMFNFYWDARPVDLRTNGTGELSRNYEYFINCSVSRMYLGVLPSDLVPIVKYILIVLISLYFTNRYVINFFEFFCYRV